MQKFISLLLVCVLLSSCSQSASPAIDLAKALPAANAISGWAPSEEARTFTHDTLFDYVDGQSEGFFAYNFQKVISQRYQNEAGAKLVVEIWQLASPEDAYGLFTNSRTGQPYQAGNNGSQDAGQRVLFWQERYFASVGNVNGAPDSDLQAFAAAVSKALPTGGERPAVIGRLPSEGLVEEGFIFFRQEISVQNEVWLGGENLLGLDAATQGLAARYAIGGQTYKLLLVQYADASKASAGLAALQGGKVNNVLASSAKDALLGAVIGKGDPAAAQKLLAEAMK